MGDAQNADVSESAGTRTGTGMDCRGSRADSVSIPNVVRNGIPRESLASTCLGSKTALFRSGFWGHGFNRDWVLLLTGTQWGR